MDNYIVTNTEKRFEINTRGFTAFIEYEIKDKALLLLHTEVPEEIGGKGIANSLADHAFKFAAAHDMKVKNYCAFISAYVKRHPELQSFIKEN